VDFALIVVNRLMALESKNKC